MNSLSETLQYLYQLKNRGIKLDLNRVYEFQNLLDYPDRSYPVFHIAGTNGKGSTTNFISAILQSGGLRAGTYTSPHIVRFNERIHINGIEISDEEIVEFVDRWRKQIDDLDLTFFETTTLMAMDYFRKMEVDVAVLETGLGGRLDATNIVTPLVSVITSIGMEHREQLGDTLAKIAREKAGIIKQEIPCVVGPVEEEAFEVIQSVAAERNAKLIESEKLFDVADVEITPAGTSFDITLHQIPYRIQLTMRGFQAARNCAIALATMQTQQRFDIPWENQLEAVASVSIPGRLQTMSSEPLIYYDVAHNYDSFHQLLDNLKVLHPDGHFQYLLGVSELKEINRLAPLFPQGQRIAIMTIPDMPLHSLESWRTHLPDLDFINYGVGTEAVVKFVQELARDDIGVIAGSHYIGDFVYRGIKFFLDSGLQ